ncbi:MAG: hypothetical protein HOV79_26640, partial [Hamadaea sp.]|nr:hypothetical protein [Hamadaea sp.]
SEDGELGKGDLDFATDLATAAAAYRDAISGQLAATAAADRPPAPRRRPARPRAGRPDADA